MNDTGKDALLGIEREDGVYTIIGKSFVYYSTESGVKGDVPLNVFSSILNANGIKNGKGAAFEYVKLNEESHLVWLYNKRTMESLWNIILWLESLI